MPYPETCVALILNDDQIDIDMRAKSHPVVGRSVHEHQSMCHQMRARKIIRKEQGCCGYVGARRTTTGETQMKSLLIAAAAIGLAAATPAFAADVDTNANSTGSKPSTSLDAGTSPAAKNEKASESTGGNGSSMGSSGTSKDMPGASDSKKVDSSLSTNGNKPKQ